MPEPATIASVIRNAVIHISNEQPLVVDLFTLPTAGDAGLLCTNVRTLDGKRPVFIDRSEATFFFPYLHIRFIEMPDAADDGSGARAGGRDARATVPGAEHAAPAHWPDPEPGSLLPVPVTPSGADDGAAEAADDLDIEIDEDFLRRVRDL